MDELGRLKAALKNSESVVYECYQDGGALTWSGDVNILAIGDEVALSSRDSYVACIHDEDRDAYNASMKAAFAETKDFRQKYRLKTSSGKIIWVEDSGIVIKQKDSKKCIIGSIRITHPEQPRDYSDSEYHYNPAFLKNLEKAINISVENGTAGSFLKILVTNLPTVISWYGNDMADHIIGELISKIKTFAKEGDVVDRIYIDQLGVILHDASKEDVKRMVARIHDFIRNYTCDSINDPISLRGCVGGVFFPSRVKNAAEALNKAYIALSTAKDPSEPAFYCDYTEAEAAHMHSKDEIGVLHYMRQAIHRDKLRLAYQPIVTTESGKAEFFECLLRIMGEEGEVSSAGTVLPIAEKMGFIDVVDQFVLEQVVDRLGEHKDITLTFNVSNMTTDNPKWLASCTKLLTDPEIASRIIVEITETAAQRDLRQTAYFVASLQALGCRVALDDFGAGYTSFRQLKSLSVDFVKIDGAFVIDVAENSENLLFIKTLIDFNNCYGLKTIAECVETGEVAKILMDVNVDYMQGYYFGLPDTSPPWLKE